MKGDLEKYGYTDNCPGCTAKKRGEIAKKGHSESCRKRIEELMRQDEEGKKKLKKEDERITTQLARKLEQEDQKKRRTEGREKEEDAEDEKKAEDEDMELHGNPDAQEEMAEMQAHEEQNNMAVDMDQTMSVEQVLLQFSKRDPLLVEWSKNENRKTTGTSKMLSCGLPGSPSGGCFQVDP